MPVGGTTTFGDFHPLAAFVDRTGAIPEGVGSHDPESLRQVTES
jgi:hypothetical protein